MSIINQLKNINIIHAVIAGANVGKYFWGGGFEKLEYS